MTCLPQEKLLFSGDEFTKVSSTNINGTIRGELCASNIVIDNVGAKSSIVNAGGENITNIGFEGLMAAGERGGYRREDFKIGLTETGSGIMTGGFVHPTTSTTTAGESFSEHMENFKIEGTSRSNVEKFGPGIMNKIDLDSSIETSGRRNYIGSDFDVGMVQRAGDVTFASYNTPTVTKVMADTVRQTGGDYDFQAVMTRRESGLTSAKLQQSDATEIIGQSTARAQLRTNVADIITDSITENMRELKFDTPMSRGKDNINIDNDATIRRTGEGATSIKILQPNITGILTENVSENKLDFDFDAAMAKRGGKASTVKSDSITMAPATMKRGSDFDFDSVMTRKESGISSLEMRQPVVNEVVAESRVKSKCDFKFDTAMSIGKDDIAIVKSDQPTITKTATKTVRQNKSDLNFDEAMAEKGSGLYSTNNTATTTVKERDFDFETAMTRRGSALSSNKLPEPSITGFTSKSVTENKNNFDFDAVMDRRTREMTSMKHNQPMSRENNKILGTANFDTDATISRTSDGALSVKTLQTNITGIVTKSLPDKKLDFDFDAAMAKRGGSISTAKYGSTNITPTSMKQGSDFDFEAAKTRRESGISSVELRQPIITQDTTESNTKNKRDFNFDSAMSKRSDGIAFAKYEEPTVIKTVTQTVTDNKRDLDFETAMARRGSGHSSINKTVTKTLNKNESDFNFEAAMVRRGGGVSSTTNIDTTIARNTEKDFDFEEAMASRGSGLASITQTVTKTENEEARDLDFEAAMARRSSAFSSAKLSEPNITTFATEAVTENKNNFDFDAVMNRRTREMTSLKHNQPVSTNILTESVRENKKLLDTVNIDIDTTITRTSQGASLVRTLQPTNTGIVTESLAEKKLDFDFDAAMAKRGGQVSTVKYDSTNIAPTSMKQGSDFDFEAAMTRRKSGLSAAELRQPLIAEVVTESTLNNKRDFKFDTAMSKGSDGVSVVKHDRPTVIKTVTETVTENKEDFDFEAAMARRGKGLSSINKTVTTTLRENERDLDFEAAMARRGGELSSTSQSVTKTVKNMERDFDFEEAMARSGSGLSSRTKTVINAGYDNENITEKKLDLDFDIAMAKRGGQASTAKYGTADISQATMKQGIDFDFDTAMARRGGGICSVEQRQSIITDTISESCAENKRDFKFDAAMSRGRNDIVIVGGDQPTMTTTVTMSVMENKTDLDFEAAMARRGSGLSSTTTTITKNAKIKERDFDFEEAMTKRNSGLSSVNQPTMTTTVTKTVVENNPDLDFEAAMARRGSGLSSTTTTMTKNAKIKERDFDFEEATTKRNSGLSSVTQTMIKTVKDEKRDFDFEAATARRGSGLASITKTVTVTENEKERDLDIEAAMTRKGNGLSSITNTVTMTGNQKEKDLDFEAAMARRGNGLSSRSKAMTETDKEKERDLDFEAAMARRATGLSSTTIRKPNIAAMVTKTVTEDKNNLNLNAVMDKRTRDTTSLDYNQPTITNVTQSATAKSGGDFDFEEAMNRRKGGVTSVELLAANVGNATTDNKLSFVVDEEISRGGGYIGMVKHDQQATTSSLTETIKQNEKHIDFDAGIKSGSALISTKHREPTITRNLTQAPTENKDDFDIDAIIARRQLKDATKKYDESTRANVVSEATTGNVTEVLTEAKFLLPDVTGVVSKPLTEKNVDLDFDGVMTKGGAKTDQLNVTNVTKMDTTEASSPTYQSIFITDPVKVLETEQQIKTSTRDCSNYSVMKTAPMTMNEPHGSVTSVANDVNKTTKIAKDEVVDDNFGNLVVSGSTTEAITPKLNEFVSQESTETQRNVSKVVVEKRYDLVTDSQLGVKDNTEQQKPTVISGDNVTPNKASAEIEDINGLTFKKTEIMSVDRNMLPLDDGPAASEITVTHVTRTASEIEKSNANIEPINTDIREGNLVTSLGDDDDDGDDSDFDGVMQRRRANMNAANASYSASSETQVVDCKVNTLRSSEREADTVNTSDSPSVSREGFSIYSPYDAISYVFNAEGDTVAKNAGDELGSISSKTGSSTVVTTIEEIAVSTNKSTTDSNMLERSTIKLSESDNIEVIDESEYIPVDITSPAEKTTNEVFLIGEAGDSQDKDAPADSKTSLKSFSCTTHTDSTTPIERNVSAGSTSTPDISANEMSEGDSTYVIAEVEHLHGGALHTVSNIVAHSISLSAGEASSSIELPSEVSSSVAVVYSQGMNTSTSQTSLKVSSVTASSDTHPEGCINKVSYSESTDVVTEAENCSGDDGTNITADSISVPAVEASSSNELPSKVSSYDAVAESEGTSTSISVTSLKLSSVTASADTHSEECADKMSDSESIEVVTGEAKDSGEAETVVEQITTTVSTISS